MIITTPSGYEVTLKDHLTFGDTRKIQKAFFSGIKLEVGQPTPGVETKPKIPEINMSAMLEYKEKALPIVVTKVVKDGKELTQNLDIEISGWDYADGQAVFDAMDKIVDPVMGMGAEEKKS